MTTAETRSGIQGIAKLLRRQFHDLTGLEQAAQRGGEAIQQSKPLRTLMQFGCAAEAIFIKIGIVQCNGGLACKSRGELHLVMAVEISLPFFQRNEPRSARPWR